MLEGVRQLRNLVEAWDEVSAVREHIHELHCLKSRSKILPVRLLSKVFSSGVDEIDCATELCGPQPHVDWTKTSQISRNYRKYRHCLKKHIILA